MAWSAPTDFPAVGIKVTRAQMQNEVKANLEFLHDPPTARVYHNTTQSIADVTDVALAFNSERRDTDTIHDNATDNSRLTCKTAGYYHIFGNVEWTDTASAGYRQLGIRLNGTTIIAQLREASIEAADDSQAVETIQHISTDYALALNDYVELLVRHNAGGAVLIANVGNYSPEFGMTWQSG